jgi:triphosphoribosyl-dephospho-CoA synthase
MGRVESQDVHDEPTVTLREAMLLAAAHDAIAREYVSDFETTFDIAAPALMTARSAGLSWNDAIVETFVTVLAAEPDTHIARRAGTAAAAEVTKLGQGTLAAGGVRTPAGRRAIDDLDRALRHDGHTLNPGATADITAAAVFVALLRGEWHTEGGAR